MYGAIKPLLAAVLMTAVITVSGGAEVNHFAPAPGEDRTVVVPTAGVIGEHAGFAGMLYSYARTSLEVDTGPDKVTMVRRQHMIQGALTYGLTDTLQVSFRLPYVLAQRSDSMFRDEIEKRGYGNTVMSAKYQLPLEPGGLRFAVSPHYSFNTGRNEAFMSGQGPMTGLRVISDMPLADDQLLVTLNLGYEYRSRERIGQIKLQHSMLYGMGAVYDIPDTPVHVSAELYGRSERLYDSKHSPVEALLSAGFDLGDGMSLIGGLAHGLNSGYGAADWRFFTGMKFDF